MGTWEIDAFNYFSVIEDGEVLDIRPAKQKALLALLVIHMNELITMDTIISGLWPSRLPGHPRKSVQVYISRLRAGLSQTEARTSPVLHRLSPGYILRIDPAQVATARFEKLTKHGWALLRANQVTEASEFFSQAIAHWGAAPYGDLTQYDFVMDERERLEEVWLAAMTGQAECLLELGNYQSAIDLLAPIVNHYPLREDLAAHFVTALSETGRRSDALLAYQRTRSSLDELGIKVGSMLYGIYQGIVE
ncbi:BTAD domain-containing putative transcriptional regulator [Streptomyces sp. NPDC058459]|uniref:AfsR/SARP family transcriptional regulator n=1 Tax=Streptomyces sp. NPDC058459 TaxID=3346508 RepID=UPI0036671245